jgi:sulfur carrier protein
MIALTINGETRSFARALTCAELVDELQLTGKRIAMERNGEIVPRSRFGDCVLQDSDRLEIVVAVGGG